MNGHGDMQPAANQAMGMGTLHSIDLEKRTVNLTHEPMPALNWPKMTMDLPVTSRVDLAAVKPGDHIHFTLKLGRDDVYRIIEMKTVVMEKATGDGDHAHH
jgi:Cu(I)/Ag(I) efflux system protein CusF